MKKVAVMTIISENYGNRLQNYALQNVLEKYGVEVETIFPDKSISIKKMTENIIKEIIIKCSDRALTGSRRVKSFYDFNKKFINISKFNYTSVYDNGVDEYDYFICGSDQIWNYTFPFVNGYYFAEFAPKNKKIAYAASFGVDKIDDAHMEQYKNWINNFKAVSVREYSGYKLVQDLTEKNAEVVIDPTLLLDAADWHKISKKSRGRVDGKKYMLKYFLGSQKSKNIDYIEKIAKENNYKIYALKDRNQPLIFEAGPCEFIDLIENAELICTDSFHACVFSILFNKPFLVFDRDGTGAGMGSRISTLLSMLGLERKMPGMVSDKDIFEHDYEHTYELLGKEKEKAERFLRKSLGLENED